MLGSRTRPGSRQLEKGRWAAGPTGSRSGGGRFCISLKEEAHPAALRQAAGDTERAGRVEARGHQGEVGGVVGGHVGATHGLTF